MDLDSISLHICFVNCARSYQIALSPDRNLRAIQDEISIQCGVPKENQVLLDRQGKIVASPHKDCDLQALDPGLGQRENPLFLYDVRISTYRPSRDFELFKPDAFRKTEASVLGIQVDSLCSFEECARVLQEQTRLANKLVLLAKERVNTCKECVREHELQWRGICAANQNLMYYVRDIKTHFIEKYDKVVEETLNSLQRFPEHIKVLECLQSSSLLRSLIPPQTEDANVQLIQCTQRYDQMVSTFRSARQNAQDVIDKHGAIDLESFMDSIVKLRNRVQLGADTICRQDCLAKELSIVPQNVYADAHSSYKDIAARNATLKTMLQLDQELCELLVLCSTQRRAFCVQANDCLTSITECNRAIHVLSPKARELKFVQDHHVDPLVAGLQSIPVLNLALCRLILEAAKRKSFDNAVHPFSWTTLFRMLWQTEARRRNLANTELDQALLHLLSENLPSIPVVECKGSADQSQYAHLKVDIQELMQLCAELEKFGLVATPCLCHLQEAVSIISRRATESLHQLIVPQSSVSSSKAGPRVVPQAYRTRQLSLPSLNSNTVDEESSLTSFTEIPSMRNSTLNERTALLHRRHSIAGQLPLADTIALEELLCNDVDDLIPSRTEPQTRPSGTDMMKNLGLNSEGLNHETVTLNTLEQPIHQRYSPSSFQNMTPTSDLKSRTEESAVVTQPSVPQKSDQGYSSEHNELLRELEELRLANRSLLHANEQLIEELDNCKHKLEKAAQLESSASQLAEIATAQNRVLTRLAGLATGEDLSNGLQSPCLHSDSGLNMDEIVRLCESVPVSTIEQQLHNELSDLPIQRSKVNDLQESIDTLAAELDAIKQTTDQADHEGELGNSRIMVTFDEEPRLSLIRFYVSALVLFIPLTNGHWFAFNLNQPHYYLSTDCVYQLRLRPERVSSWVGRIIHIDRHIATEDYNPYDLMFGTEFHIVFAEEYGRSKPDKAGHGHTLPRERKSSSRRRSSVTASA